MKSKPLFFILSSFCLLFFFSCGSSNSVNCSNNYATELQAEINAISDASIIYSNDPTPENCEAFKDAYRDYLDALKPYADCGFTGTQEDEFNQAIAAAEASIDQLVC